MDGTADHINICVCVCVLCVDGGLGRRMENGDNIEGEGMWTARKSI